MLPVYAVVFQLGSIFSDFEIIMKIAGLLFIVSFVKQHIQNVLLSTVLILGLAAFLLFDFWKIFGSALFMYLLVSFGVLHTIVDLSFLGAFQKRPSKEEMQRAQAEQQRQGGQEEYDQEGYPRHAFGRGREMEPEEEEEEHGGHHMYSEGTANVHRPGQAKHSSSGKHSSGSLGGISPHQLQQMMQTRGGHGGR